MQINKVHIEKGNYLIEFTAPHEAGELFLKVAFQNDWFLIEPTETLSDLPSAASFWMSGKTVRFPYEINSNLLSIPLHIPNAHGRNMFKLCMDVFVKQAQAPIHIHAVEHPGYPLLLVTFDNYVIEEFFVTELIESVMAGIRGAEIVFKETEKPEEHQTEEDEINEDHIIEYEEDEELKAIMKEPVNQLITSLEGEGMYD